MAHSSGDPNRVVEYMTEHTNDIWRDLTDAEKIKYGITETEKMRTKETIEKEIEALQKELESLPKGRWRANEGEDYWCLYDFNEVILGSDARLSVENSRYALGNYFKTHSSAEKEARHREFEQKVSARFDELNGERLWFDLSIYNIQILIDLDDGKVKSYLSGVLSSHRNWVSRDSEIVEQIIKEFGAENFLKYARGEL